MQTKNINLSRDQSNDNCELQKSCRQDHQGLPSDVSVTHQCILNQVTRSTIGSTYHVINMFNTKRRTPKTSVLAPRAAAHTTRVIRNTSGDRNLAFSRNRR
ncbi:unnamed protein product, partial [Iphiclides podalirius]